MGVNLQPPLPLPEVGGGVGVGVDLQLPLPLPEVVGGVGVGVRELDIHPHAHPSSNFREVGGGVGENTKMDLRFQRK